MGGCLSLKARVPSEFGDGDVDLANVARAGVVEDGRTTSLARPKIEVPFEPVCMMMNGTNEMASIFAANDSSKAIVHEFLLGGRGMMLCGLFDGHGSDGALVSEKVRDGLPVKLISEWRSLLSGEEEETRPYHEDLFDNELDEVDTLPEVLMPLQNSIFKAFMKMDAELREDYSLNTYGSGTTAITVVKKGRDLLVGNLGKSRAVLATRYESHNLMAEQLTVDLKPNLACELDRIRRCGGRVFPRREEPGLCRFFLPGSEAPGLAVSRAFGDFCVKRHGLSSIPQLSHRRLASSDELLIIANHAVWEVVSNQEAVEIMASAANKEAAARELVERARKAWSLRIPGVSDIDISAICIDLDAKIDEPVDEVPPPEEADQEVPPPEQPTPPPKPDLEEVEPEDGREEEPHVERKRSKFIFKMPKFLKKMGGRSRRR